MKQRTDIFASILTIWLSEMDAPPKFEECAPTYSKVLFMTYLAIWQKQNDIVKSGRVCQNVGKITNFRLLSHVEVPLYLT